MGRIIVQPYLITGRRLKENEVISKDSNEEITIGRDSDNDIIAPTIFTYVSRKHGKIFLEKGVFTSHLDYLDFSAFGSTVFHWDGFTAQSESVHGRKIKLKPGDWVIISNEVTVAHERFGILLIVQYEE